MRAFSLTELLVGIVIVFALGGLVLESTRQVRRTSDTVVCMNNLRQLGIAFQLYAEANAGRLPFPNASYGGSGANPQLCWFNALDPHLLGGAAAVSKSTERLHLTKQDPIIQKLGQPGTPWYADSHTLKMNEWLVRDPDGAAGSEYLWSLTEFRNPSQTVLLFDGKAEMSKTANGLPGTTATQTQGTEGEVMTRHRQKANVLFADGRVALREETRQTTGDRMGWKANETSLAWKPWVEPK